MPVGQLLLLTDGRVMALATDKQSWFILTPDSAGNYNDGTWTAAAPMNVARDDFVSNVLADGQVLVLGGEHASDNPAGFTSSSEIYNPVANTWTLINPAFPGPLPPPPPNGPDSGGGPAPSELIQDANGNSRVLVGSFWSPQTYLLNWAAQPPQWIGPVAKFQEPDTGVNDASGEEGWVQLPDGSVLAYDSNRSSSTNGDNAFRGDRFFPSTDTWQDASQLDPQAPPLTLGFFVLGANEIGPPMLLPNGEVFWMGANNNSALYNPAGTTTDALYGPTPVTEYGIWTQGPTQPVNGEEEPVAMLPDGDILLSNGIGNGYVWEYNSANSQFFQQPTNSGPAGGGILLDLPNGHVLMSTGTQVWDFNPGSSQSDINDAWRPQIQGTVTHTAGDPRGTFTLTGTQLTGISEGSTEGDDEEMSTNYPIVELTLGSNVWYAKTHDWTPGVDEGSTSVKFDLPANLSPGATYSLTVVANGIPSYPINFTPVPDAIYADSQWANTQLFPNGTVIPDADPVAPGAQARTIGTDAFATVDAAIAAAGPGGVVIVNGANGPSGSGVFHEQVAVNSSVEVYLQNGPVAFDSLAGNTASGIVALGGSVLTAGADNTGTEYDGTIAGVGGLVKAGSGTLDLTGTNTYAGTGGNAATTIDQGTLEVASDAQLGATDALLAFNGGTLDATGIFTSARPIALNLGGGVIETTGAAATASSTISGQGSLTVAGTGILTLAGTDNATGPTEVVAGATLVVTGGGILQSSGVMVDDGGTLRGFGGRINGTVTVAGTLEGGTPTNTGTALIVGSLTFTSTGVLATQLNSPSAYDKVSVISGVATLTGATLELTPSYLAVAGTQFTLIHDTNSMNTSFANGPVISVGGQYFSVTYTAQNVTLTALPSVASVQVNDGSVQRSEVTSVTVTFNGPVSFAGGNAAAAFELQNLSDNNFVTLGASTTTNGQGQTVATLTFSGSETDPVSALNGGAPSLADGLYKLTVVSSDVTDANGDPLNGGTNYVSPTDTYGGAGLHLYRLFGDANGDGVVDQLDLAMFRGALSSSIGDSEYLYYFDSDNSGTIDMFDLAQFRARFDADVFG